MGFIIIGKEKKNIVLYYMEDKMLKMKLDNDFKGMIKTHIIL